MSWQLLLPASLLFAAIVSIPDLLIWWKHPRQWVPVNGPPYSLSDDYHYFSVLNIFHGAWLARSRGVEKIPIRLSAASWLAITTLIFNLLPYHVGYALSDRRGAIFAVRAWNHAIFFAATALAVDLLLAGMGFAAPPLLPILVTTVHYVSYPALVSFAATSSILFNLGTSDHIYRRAHSNDISRAFNLGTSGALLMLGVVWLLLPGEVLTSSGLRAAVAFGFNALLYFSYLPIACVYGLLCVTDYAVNGQWYVAATSAALNVICLGLYFRIAAHDQIMKEIVVHLDAGKVFKATKARTVEALAVLCAPLFIYLVTPEVQPRFIALLCASAVCVLTIFLHKHQGGRFWDRSAILIFQLLLLTWAAGWLLDAELLGTLPMVAALTAVTGVLIWYEILNTRQLEASRSKLASEWIAETGYLSGKTGAPTQIITDSVDIAYYTFLYTGDYSLLKNYSVQHHGYRENLREFCLNFKLAGYSLKEVLTMFSIRAELGDWMGKREQLDTDVHARARSVLYALQFLATYHDYNQLIRDEEMYVAGEWTPKMRALIEQTWHSVSPDARADYRLILDPHGEIRRAIREAACAADGQQPAVTPETSAR